jgi:hypothetical protein
MNETDNILIAWAWIFAGMALISAGLRVAIWLMRKRLERAMLQQQEHERRVRAELDMLMRLSAERAWQEAKAEQVKNDLYFQAAMRDDL